MKELSLFDENTKNQNTGLITSVVLHLLLLLLVIIFPGFSHMDPPPQLQGIMVNLGDPTEDISDNQQSSASSSDSKDVKDSKSVKRVEKQEKKSTKIIKKESPKSKAIVDDTKSSTIKVDDQAKKTAIENARIAKEEAEQRKKALEYQKAKSKFGNLFGSGKSDKDNNTKGVPDGKPNANVLEGVTKGYGTVGGGLKDRGLEYKPEFKDNSQKEGKVVIKVCVDASGKVISTKYTQRGSTTSDSELIAIARKNAKKYRFSPFEMDEQCGKVTVEFKLR